MKLQHNSRGESSEDLIALIIAAKRERGKGKHEEDERERRQVEECRTEEPVGEVGVGRCKPGVSVCM